MFIYLFVNEDSWVLWRGHLLSSRLHHCGLQRRQLCMARYCCCHALIPGERTPVMLLYLSVCWTDATGDCFFDNLSVCLSVCLSVHPENAVEVQIERWPENSLPDGWLAEARPRSSPGSNLLSIGIKDILRNIVVSFWIFLIKKHSSWTFWKKVSWQHALMTREFPLADARPNSLRIGS